jgi:hypothetical protein
LFFSKAEFRKFFLLFFNTETSFKSKNIHSIQERGERERAGGTGRKKKSGFGGKCRHLGWKITPNSRTKDPPDFANPRGLLLPAGKNQNEKVAKEPKFCSFFVIFFKRSFFFLQTSAGQNRSFLFRTSLDSKTYKIFFFLNSQKNPFSSHSVYSIENFETKTHKKEKKELKKVNSRGDFKHAKSPKNVQKFLRTLSNLQNIRK